MNNNKHSVLVQHNFVTQFKYMCVGVATIQQLNSYRKTLRRPHSRVVINPANTVLPLPASPSRASVINNNFIIK